MKRNALMFLSGIGWVWFERVTIAATRYHGGFTDIVFTTPEQVIEARE